MPRFSLSLGYFFTQSPVEERFAHAAAAGFGAVELFWPEGVNPVRLVRARQASGLEVSLFNMNEGDYGRGDRGFACRPERRDWWREQLHAALTLAGALDCTRINVLSGRIDGGAERGKFLQCFVENLDWAAPLANSAGVQLVIEPLNHITHPLQLCQRTADVLEVLDLVANPAVALQYDVFHAQRSEGNIVATVRQHIARIAHVQIADVPSRSAPGTGEINFRFVLDELDRAGYTGFVGLEYMAPPAPLGAFDWIETYGYERG